MISSFTRSFVIAFCSVLVLVRANAIDWPPDYTVLENSTSPDGRYGVLVVSHEAAVNDNRTEDDLVYLANLQTRQTLFRCHSAALLL